MAFGIPLDPAAPRDPLVIARERPQSVTVAAVLMLGGAAVGTLSAIALFVSSALVVREFRAGAARLGIPLTDINAVAPVIRATLLSGGLGTLLLAVLVAFAARGVLRRNPAARAGALALAGLSLLCAFMSTSITALGRNVRWTVNVDHASAALVGEVAQSYSDAMPSWLVGLAGGLTDLQTLGYIAVAVLLLMPASQEYFRSRVAPS